MPRDRSKPSAFEHWSRLHARNKKRRSVPMNRTTRTVVVVAIAVARRGAWPASASIGPSSGCLCARWRSAACIRWSPRTTCRWAADDHQGPRQAGGLAGEQSGRKGFTTVESVLNRGLIAVGRRKRAADRVEARATRSGRRPAAVDYRGHARRVGEGQRGHRRRRLRRPRNARRRAWSRSSATTRRTA